MAENRAREIRQMILDEMDTAIENAKNTEVESGAQAENRYSVKIGYKEYLVDDSNSEMIDEDGRIIPIVQSVFVKDDVSDSKIIRELVREEIDKLRFETPITIKETGEVINTAKDAARKYTHSGFTKYAPAKDIAAKMNASLDLRTMIENAVNKRWEQDRDGKHGARAGRGWNYYDTNFAVKHHKTFDIYTGELQICLNSKDGRDYFYDVAKLRRTKSFHAMDFSAHAGQLGSSIDTLEQRSNGVNIENGRRPSESNSEVYSVEIDSDGRELSDAQQAYFKDNNFLVNVDDAVENTLESVYRASSPIQRGLNAMMREVSEELGFPYEDTEQKSIDSMRKKVKRKGDGYSLLSMKDHTRTKIMMQTYEQIPEVLDKFDSLGIPYHTEYVTNKWGYKGFHVTWTNQGGVNSEVQLTTEKVWPLKEWSDKIYKKWRNFDVFAATPEEKKQYATAIKESRSRWSKADIQDLSIYERTSSAVGSRLFHMSSPYKGEDALTHAPEINSSTSFPSDMGAMSSSRPSSVKQRSRITNAPFDEELGDISPRKDIISQTGAEHKGDNLRHSLSFFDEIFDGDDAELSCYETMFTEDADMQQSFDTAVPILEEGAEALKAVPVSKQAARRVAI